MLPGIKQFDLTGRAAIITGGSKGLGEAMAAGLASAGADVLLTSRNAEEVDATAKTGLPPILAAKTAGIVADVSSEDGRERDGRTGDAGVSDGSTF